MNAAAKQRTAEQEVRKDFATLLISSFAHPARRAFKQAKTRTLADQLAYLDVWELARQLVHNEVPAEIAASEFAPAKGETP